MARTKGTVVENNFIGGLNTEANALAFPPNACTETFNCIFDEFGRVSRRPELDIEKDAQYYSASEYANTQIFTEYLWVNAGGTGLINLYVVQVGSVLFFYDVSSSTNISNNQIIDFINLDAFTATDTIYDPRDEPCQYANGNGNLIVTNKACDPILIKFDPNAIDRITGSRITIRYRDFQGLSSIYRDDQRPSFPTIAAMKADLNGAIHFYNLLNQGWHNGGITAGSPNATSALGLWDASTAASVAGVMPSNMDYIGYYRSSATVPFDANRVDVNSQGNTLAPKGHFILELGNADRRAALEEAGYTLTYTSSNRSSLMSGSTGTTIGGGANAGANYGAVFDLDGSTGVAETEVYTIGGSKSLAFFAGKDYGVTTRRVSKVIIRPWNNSYGFARQVPTGNYETMTITMELRASNSAPSTGSEGTLLGSKTIVVNSGLGQSQHTISSSDISTLYRYVWVRMSASFTVQPFIDTNGALYLGDLLFYQNVTTTGTGSLPDADKTIERPNTCAFYAGRAWYAGVNSSELSTRLYYSQIIENETQYGRCYQQNDPTSELNAAVLPTDGGVIQIPEIGKIVKLYAQQSALLVFATNGVWVIQGSDFGAAFEPTSFVIRRISSLGTQSPMSFIDVEGLPMWWAEDGICRMEYNPQFNSFNVVTISEDTIQTFFDEIPAQSRSSVKGAYDSRNSRVLWLYRSDNISEVTTPNEYNRVLVLNVKTKAFYPWSFIISNLTPQIKGIGYVSDAVGYDSGVIKFSISVPISSTQHRVTYADMTKETPEYIDFKNFSVGLFGSASDAKDYSSYFVTGYRLDAEANKFFQSMYILLYLKVETNSGAFLQGIFDFANTAQTGDWSVRQQASKQQVYNLDNVQRDFHARRLKVRGRGRALQFRVSSQTGKPFTIIGWSNAQTGNADV